MTKVANSYYSTAVGHREISGIYLATFALPGEAPMWVTDPKDGKPKHFTSATEAELAGFRVMASKLNRARQEQDFHVKGHRAGSNGSKNTIKSWSATPRAEEHTVQSVFGKKP